jgi:hypothetical protein
MWPARLLSIVWKICSATFVCVYKYMYLYQRLFYKMQYFYNYGMAIIYRAFHNVLRYYKNL